MIRYRSLQGSRCQTSLSFLGKMRHPLWSTSLGSSSNVEKQGMLMHSRYDCSLHLCQDRRSHGSPHYQTIPSSSGLIWNSSSILIFFWHQWDEDHWSNQTQAKERWNSSWIRSEIQRSQKQVLQSKSRRQATSWVGFPRSLANLEREVCITWFESLNQLVSRMSQETTKSYEPRRNIQ
jgi:hypothetical protein